MISFFSGGSFPTIFQPIHRKTKRPSQRVNLFPIRGLDAESMLSQSSLILKIRFFKQRQPNITHGQAVNNFDDIRLLEFLRNLGTQ